MLLSGEFAWLLRVRKRLIFVFIVFDESQVTTSKSSVPPPPERLSPPRSCAGRLNLEIGNLEFGNLKIGFWIPLRGLWVFAAPFAPFEYTVLFASNPPPPPHEPSSLQPVSQGFSFHCLCTCKKSFEPAFYKNAGGWWVSVKLGGTVFGVGIFFIAGRVTWEAAQSFFDVLPLHINVALLSRVTCPAAVCVPMYVASKYGILFYLLSYYFILFDLIWLYRPTHFYIHIYIYILSFSLIFFYIPTVKNLENLSACFYIE